MATAWHLLNPNRIEALKEAGRYWPGSAGPASTQSEPYRGP